MAKQVRTLEERIIIIDKVEKNPFEKKINIAKRLGISASTLKSIILKKKEIREQADKYGTSAKKKKSNKMSTYSAEFSPGSKKGQGTACGKRALLDSEGHV